MPCTACGSAAPVKNFSLNKPKPKTTQKVRYLTRQQAIAYRSYLASRSKMRRTLVF